MRTLDVGQKQATYTGVIIHAGQTDNGQSIDYTAGVVSGDNVGSVLEVTVPNGSYELACALLSTLKLRGYQYQPFEADGAIADPSIEIGDNITANGVSSIVMGINTNHSRLMASTLKAPFDEEVNHEWTYEPRSERQFKRESAYTRSRLTINENEITAEVVRATNAENVLSSRISITADNITAEVARATAAEGTLRSSIQINADNITAEVTRATNAEGNLSSRITQNADNITAEVTRATTSEENLSTRITQNADNITAEVTRATNAEGSLSSRITQNATDITAKVSKSGGSSSSFAWTLTDSSWTLTSNGTDVFKVTSGGAEVKGKITATSGYIGTESNGFEITASAIRNGMTGRDDTTNNGIYLGTNGIALGAGKFKVTDAGVLTATSGTIGGFTFTGTALSKSTPDVSTDGQSQYQVMLQAPTTAGTSNAAIVVRHRTYNDGAYGSWENDFSLTYGGNLTANNGTFGGTVRANKIAYGNDAGYFPGQGIGAETIGGSKLIDRTLTGSKIGFGQVTGGTDSYGYPSGNIASSSVSYGNVAFTGTLDQVGTNKSNIEAINGYFTGSASFNGLSANYIQLNSGYLGSLYCDYLDLDEGYFPVVKWRYTS